MAETPITYTDRAKRTLAYAAELQAEHPEWTMAEATLEAIILDLKRHGPVATDPTYVRRPLFGVDKP